MDGSPEQPWSDGSNTLGIPYPVYVSEKANFSGFLISAMLYGAPVHASVDPRSLPIQSTVTGIVVGLFFQCLGALLNPANNTRDGVRWGLAAHVTIMFPLATINNAMSLDVQSVSYIDGREVPGVYGVLPPGPFGYQFLIFAEPISVVPTVMFLLNNWLADGFLVSFPVNYMACV